MTSSSLRAALTFAPLALSLPMISSCGAGAASNGAPNAEPPPPFMRVGAVKRAEEPSQDAEPPPVATATATATAEPSQKKPDMEQKQPHDEESASSVSPISPAAPLYSKSHGKSVETATGDSSGALTEEDVRATITQKQSSLRGCYELGARRMAAFAGTVSLKVSINGDGHVSGVDVQGSTTNNSDVDACVRGAIAQMQFPAKGSNAVVLFPIDFGR